MYLLNITNQEYKIVCNIYRCEYEIIDMYLLNTTNQGLKYYAKFADVYMK